jgi:DNA polymerase-3 subunit epsilon
MHIHHRTVDPPLLFLDLETGGLDANRDEILEVGAVVTTPDGALELGRIDARVRALRPEQITDVARDINGYSAAGWRVARPLGDVLAELLDLASGTTLVGHNVCFDWGFILAALRAHGLVWSGNGRYLDTMALAPLAAGWLPDRRLLTMAAHLGIPTAGAHRALVDASMCRAVFLRLAPERPRSLEETLPPGVVRCSPVVFCSSWRAEPRQIAVGSVSDTDAITRIRRPPERAVREGGSHASH